MDDARIELEQWLELLGEFIDEPPLSSVESAHRIKAIIEEAFASLGRDASEIPFEIILFRETLDEETDRGCALMAASYLDVELEKLLRGVLVDDDKAADLLFTGTGGLSTFSARIDMAYLMGLISPLMRRDLHLIRRIRNDFAHNPEPIDFSSPKIASRCDELHHDYLGEKIPPRKKFARVVVGMLGCLHGAAKMSQRAVVHGELDFDSIAARERTASLKQALDAATGMS